MAGKEEVYDSYVSRMVNLTTLAAAILDEKLPPELTLFELAVDPPALWEEQPSARRMCRRRRRIDRDRWAS